MKQLSFEFYAEAEAERAQAAIDNARAALERLGLGDESAEPERAPVPEWAGKAIGAEAARKMGHEIAGPIKCPECRCKDVADWPSKHYISYTCRLCFHEWRVNRND